MSEYVATNVLEVTVKPVYNGHTQGTQTSGHCRQVSFLGVFFNTHFILEGDNMVDHYRQVATKTGLAGV